MNLQPFDTNDAAHIAAATRIWNEACGPELSISERFVRYNTDPAFWNSQGRWQAGRVVVDDGEITAFVLATVQKEPYAAPPYSGTISAIAVAPGVQRRGVGRTLMQWADGWLGEQGCASLVLGADARPFVPGVPDELNTAPFFHTQGFQPHRDYGWSVDMAHDLRDYVTPPTARKAQGVATRSCRLEDVDAMLSFLSREFPGGWFQEADEHVRSGGRLSDYILLWSERGVEGCALLTLEDSRRPLDRFYPHRLPHPWGQLGAIGVSADRRGQGYGAVLLDGGLRYLRDQGVRGCVIDWLVLVDFYARFGFSVHRRYAMMGKEM